jgi:Tol biopolymer transport system component
MTTNDRFEAIVARWLEAGPTAAPEEAISAALRYADTHPHPGGLRAALLRAMPASGALAPARPAARFAWLALVAALLVAALAGGALVAGLWRPPVNPPAVAGTIAVAWNGDIWVVDPETGAAANITNTPDLIEAGPAFSPDGTYVAYTAGDAARDNQLLRDAVILSKSDGTDRRTLVDDRSLGNDPTISWSPDGRIVAAGGQLGAVYWDTAQDARLTAGLPGAGSGGLALSGGWPAFSPDGRRIAFVGADQVVRVLRLADGSVTALPAPDELSSWDALAGPPAWTPDGRLIIFDVLRADLGHQVCLADPDTGVVRAQRAVPFHSDLVAAGLASSPDGTRYGLLTEGEVVLVTIDGRSERGFAIDGPAFRDLWTNEPFAWSPDGRTIATLERAPDAPAIDTSGDSYLPVTVEGWRLVLHQVDGSGDPHTAWNAPGACTLSGANTCPRPFDIDWTPAELPIVQPNPGPAATPSPVPSATPIACSAAAEFRQAVEALEATSPWDRRDVTLEQLRAAFEQVRTTGMSAVSSTSGALRRAFVDPPGQPLPDAIEAFGAWLDSLGPTLPGFGSSEAYRFEALAEPIAAVADGLPAPGPGDCASPGPQATPQAIVADRAGDDATCSSISAETAPSPSGEVWTVSMQGRPWVRITVSPAVVRPSIGSLGPGEGDVFLEVTVTYEALQDGVLPYGADHTRWEIRSGPWIYTEGQAACPCLTENLLPVGHVLKKGEQVSGRLAYEVPATGAVDLNIPAFVPDPQPNRRYWTLPSGEQDPRFVGCAVHPFVLRAK